MFRRTVSAITIAMLLISTLMLAFDIQQARASGEPPPTEWTQPYGGTSSDTARALVRTSDGGYAIAGYTSSYGAGGSDAWLVKTDASGHMQWNQTYGGAGGDIANALVQTVDGGYALAGYTDSYGAGGVDFWLVKADSSGNPQWNKTYGGTKTDIANTLIQTADGGYALGGMTVSYCIGEADFWLVKTDANGNAQWTHAYGGAVHEEGQSLVQTVDGGYALAGWTNSYGAGADDMWLVKTDSALNPQWNKTYGGTWYDEAYALVRTTDGGYALAGETVASVNSAPNSYLVKTDGNGNTQWEKTYGGPISNHASALVQTTDGGYALAGHTYPPANIYCDFWLVKTDSTGNQQWDKTLGGADHDIANALVQTVDGGYALAGRTNSYGAGGSDFWLVKIAPSNGGPPEDCGWPVLVAPVQISSSGGYNVGDTLMARFTIQNQGTAAIHLDKLLLGGRFDGGTLPGGGFPDFTFRTVTLQVGQTYEYEGTLYLTDAGYYQFFVAYYIANPTQAEKQLLDSNNWNTCIDLAPGLTDNDRTWSVQVITSPGNLRAVSIEPVQVVWGADLVQDKLTDFKIGYESTFDVTVEADIILDLPGFSPNSYLFTYKFAPGSSSFVIGSVQGSSPFFLARTKPEATFKFSIDPNNHIVETDETDNTFPRAGYEQRKVINTKPMKILFVPVMWDKEDWLSGRYFPINGPLFFAHVEESIKYLKATYPLAESEVSYGTGSSSARAITPINAGPRPTNIVAEWFALNNLLKKLTQLAVSANYDRVEAVVYARAGAFFVGDTVGWTRQVSGVRATIVTMGCWSTGVHELGHTYGLVHSNLNGGGYYVAGRQYVLRQTFMSTDAIEYPPHTNIWNAPVPQLWIRSEEYQQLLKALTDGADPEVLLASGTVWLNGSVALDYWYHLPMATLDLEEGGSGNYSIVQLDSVGNKLSTIRFNATFVDIFHGRLFDAMPFAFTIPYSPGAKVIQILNATDHVIASRIISDNAPTVHIISPNGGEVLASESVQISWEGSDLDGDSVVYDLLISGDGGLTWNPIETDLTQTTYDLPLTGFSGGNEYIVKVISSDGVNTGEDTSDGFFTIVSFATNVVTAPQSISSGSKANYTLCITSYGGFSNPIVLNATSSTTDKLLFRWINGSAILPVPNGSTNAVLEVEVPYVTEGGNHTVILSCTSGNSTEVAIAYLFVSSHDLAVTDITPSKTVVGQSFSMTVNVTVENQGNFGETFTVSLYGNQTLVQKSSRYLPAQKSTTLTVTWNTFGFAKGNYTISMVADSVPGENYTADNTLTYGGIVVTIPGDVDGNSVVNIFDVVQITSRYGKIVPPVPPDSNADIDGNGVINIFDVVICTGHYGQKWP